MTDLCLGKLPAAPKPTDFKLKDVLEVELPSTPTSPFGYGHLFHDWGMLGNDSQGDCVWAGADHETMLWNRLAGHPVAFTPTNALDDYHAVVGPEDVGTDVHQAMSYRKATGVVDENGNRHKIDAYLSIDPGDFNLMLTCTRVFGCVGIGIEFPESAMEQFNEGKPWDVVAGSQIDGGHYIPCVGSTNPSSEVTIITWAKRQPMTKAFYEKYCDEAWVPLSFEQMNAHGLGLHHISKAKLQSLFDALP